MRITSKCVKYYKFFKSNSLLDFCAKPSLQKSVTRISVSDDANISDILNDIGAEIEVMLDSAIDNPSILSRVCDYFNELSNLDQEYDNMISLQANYDNVMKMTPENNKIALGL